MTYTMIYSSEVFLWCLFAALGEALGAIGDPEVLPILEEYAKDPVVEVSQALL